MHLSFVVGQSAEVVQLWLLPQWRQTTHVVSVGHLTPYPPKMGHLTHKNELLDRCAGSSMAPILKEL